MIAGGVLRLGLLDSLRALRSSKRQGVPLARQRRESRQDLGACKKAVMLLLTSSSGKYVTAGWIEDRGLPFNEHTIAVVLRKLANEQRIDHVFEQGFQRYAYRSRAELAEVIRERNLRRKLGGPEEEAKEA